MRQSVHNAALSTSRSNTEEVKPEKTEQGVKHFFTPIVTDNSLSKEDVATKESFRTSPEYNRHTEKSAVIKRQDSEEQHHYVEDMSGSRTQATKPASKCLSYNGFSESANSLSDPVMQRTEAGCENNGAEFIRPFSPPLLTELSSFSDTFDELLGAEDFELSDVALEGVWFNPSM